MICCARAVIIFVLRLLKVADFQPRIALVTRTLKNSFIDLVHFFLLFGIVILGYCVAGMLLYGRQYEGFSTMQQSFFYLLIILIAWDPSSAWVQVNRCRPCREFPTHSSRSRSA